MLTLSCTAQLLMMNRFIISLHNNFLICIDQKKDVNKESINLDKLKHTVFVRTCTSNGVGLQVLPAFIVTAVPLKHQQQHDFT